MHAIPRGTSCNIPVSELAICIAILFLELVKETSPFLKTGIDTLHHFLTQSCSIAEHSIFLSCKNRAADSDAPEVKIIVPSSRPKISITESLERSIIFLASLPSA